MAKISRAQMQALCGVVRSHGGRCYVNPRTRRIVIRRGNPDTAPAVVVEASKPVVVPVPTAAGPVAAPKTNPQTLAGAWDRLRKARTLREKHHIAAWIGGHYPSEQYKLDAYFKARRSNPHMLKGIKGSKALALRILDWHGGQSSACYLVGSRWHSGLPCQAIDVRDCVWELEKNLHRVVEMRASGKGYTLRDQKQLQSLIADVKRKIKD